MLVVSEKLGLARLPLQTPSHTEPTRRLRVGTLLVSAVVFERFRDELLPRLLYLSTIEGVIK